MARREEGEYPGYLINEQRSHTGWISSSKCEVIFERALNASEKQVGFFGVSVSCFEDFRDGHDRHTKSTG
jgi:hypothetical protein